MSEISEQPTQQAIEHQPKSEDELVSKIQRMIDAGSIIKQARGSVSIDETELLTLVENLREDLESQESAAVVARPGSGTNSV